MAKKRYVSDSFRCDPRVEDLDPLERYLFLYLITNQYVSICGIYEIKIKRVAFETGIEKDMVEKILGRFQEAGKVFYNDGIIFIVNFIKNQSLKKETDNLRKGVIREVQEIGRSKIEKVTTLQGAYKVVQGAYKNLDIPYLTLLYPTKPNLTSPNTTAIAEPSETGPILDVVISFVESQKIYHQVSGAISRKGLDDYLAKEQNAYRLLLKDFTKEQIDFVLSRIPRDDFRCDKAMSIEGLRKKKDGVMKIEKIIDAIKGKQKSPKTSSKVYFVS